jgi:hypothetical protein
VTPAPTRWPLHPTPGPLESLSSWLDRLALLYGLTTKHLLGPLNLEYGGMYAPYLLDADPPPVVLTELAKRTGVDLEQLKAMTLAGWAPCLFDQVQRPHGGWVVKYFISYVRSNTVLLPYGEAGSVGEGFSTGGEDRGHRYGSGPANARCVLSIPIEAETWCGSCHWFWAAESTAATSKTLSR